MGVSPLLKYGAFPSHRKKLSITRSEGAVKGKIHLLGTGRDRRALLFTSLLRARGERLAEQAGFQFAYVTAPTCSPAWHMRTCSTHERTR